MEGARCTALRGGAEATRGGASSSGEVGLITRRAGVPLVQDSECRPGRQGPRAAVVQDGCKMGARWQRRKMGGRVRQGGAPCAGSHAVCRLTFELGLGQARAA